MSNFSRNVVLHSGIPKITEPGVELLHKLLGIDINDPKTTWLGTTFGVPRLSSHEDSDGNPLHLLLLFLSIVAYFFYKDLRRTPCYLQYICALIIGFFLFCLYLKWQPWHSRLHLPLFVMFSPISALFLSNCRSKRFVNIIIIILLFSSLPWVLYNRHRPLLGKDSILTTSRIQQYFRNRPHIKTFYEEATQLIVDRDCHSIGLQIGGDDWEYPLWVLLHRNQNNKYHINHVNVHNVSGTILHGDYNPCVLINIGKGGRVIVTP